MTLSAAELRGLDGQPVIGKRLGWDGSLDAVTDLEDPEPYNDLDDYDTDDLEGDLDVRDISAVQVGEASIPAQTMYLIGGQEADPDSIEPVEADPAVAARKQTFGDPVVGHRQPNAFELAAGTDFEILQQQWQDATADIVSVWRTEIQAAQIDSLVEQVRAAVEAGNTTALASLSAPVQGVDTLLAAMREMAEDALVGAKEEAAAQGVSIGTINMAEQVDPLLASRAQATATLLARGISDSAARAALNLGTDALDPDDVALAVRAHLEALTDAFLQDMIGGAMTQAQNTGRRAVMAEQPARIYASELLDQNTCTNCSSVDAREYSGITDAEKDYPTGGYRDCQGGPRCRGTLVAVYDEAEES
jgi:hypothetical protein